MMSNERQSQPSTPMLVAKDTKDYPLQNKKDKIKSTYLKQLTYTTDE